MKNASLTVLGLVFAMGMSCSSSPPSSSTPGSPRSARRDGALELQHPHETGHGRCLGRHERVGTTELHVQHVHGLYPPNPLN